MPVNSFNANNSIPESGRLTAEEKEGAKKTAEETVKEAQSYSNPDIPFPLKLTGLAVLAFLIWKTG